MSDNHIQAGSELLQMHICIGKILPGFAETKLD